MVAVDGAAESVAAAAFPRQQAEQRLRASIERSSSGEGLHYGRRQRLRQRKSERFEVVSSRRGSCLAIGRAVKLARLEGSASVCYARTWEAAQAQHTQEYDRCQLLIARF